MTNPPRTFTLKDQASAAVAYGSACRRGSRGEMLKLDVGFAGEVAADSANGGMSVEVHVLPEGGREQDDAAREWLRHVEAGHFE